MKIKKHESYLITWISFQNTWFYLDKYIYKIPKSTKSWNFETASPIVAHLALSGRGGSADYIFKVVKKGPV